MCRLRCLWKEDAIANERVSFVRVEEALQVGAKIIATACPFCLAMFEETLRKRAKDDMEVRDVVELVDRAFQ